MKKSKFNTHRFCLLLSMAMHDNVICVTLKENCRDTLKYMAAK